MRTLRLRVACLTASLAAAALLFSAPVSAAPYTFTAPPTGHAAYDSGDLTPGNPLAGHPWFVDYHWGPLWEQVRAWQYDHPDLAGRIAHLAQEPVTKSFGAFEPNPRLNLRRYLDRAALEDPGAIPMIALSRIAHQSCPYQPPSADYQPAAYERWVQGFVDALGDYRVMVLVEPDRIATMACLPRSAQNQRYELLRYDMKLLRQDPNAIIYLDAGASNWVWNTSALAARLRRAGVGYGQGFALNASHFDTTAHNIAYGLRVSRALHGAHFIINTDANGNGPTPDSLRWKYHGCQPPNVGVGLRPTVNTGNPLVDAFLWLDTPGFAAGSCIGHPSGGYKFYPDLALKMERNANPSF